MSVGGGNLLQKHTKTHFLLKICVFIFMMWFIFEKSMCPHFYSMVSEICTETSYKFMIFTVWFRKHVLKPCTNLWFLFKIWFLCDDVIYFEKSIWKCCCVLSAYFGNMHWNLLQRYDFYSKFDFIIFLLLFMNWWVLRSLYGRVCWYFINLTFQYSTVMWKHTNLWV